MKTHFQELIDGPNLWGQLVHPQVRHVEGRLVLTAGPRPIWDWEVDATLKNAKAEHYVPAPAVNVKRWMRLQLTDGTLGKMIYNDVAMPTDTLVEGGPGDHDWTGLKVFSSAPQMASKTKYDTTVKTVETSLDANPFHPAWPTYSNSGLEFSHERSEHWTVGMTQYHFLEFRGRWRNPDFTVLNPANQLADEMHALLVPPVGAALHMDPSPISIEVPENGFRVFKTTLTGAAAINTYDWAAGGGGMGMGGGKKFKFRLNPIHKATSDNPRDPLGSKLFWGKDTWY